MYSIASNSLPVAICDRQILGRRESVFAVTNYDLASTLTSGQAFRWTAQAGSWVGIIGARWVRLTESMGKIHVQTACDVDDWQWLSEYLQLDTELTEIIREFPTDPPMRTAIEACRGLRLLRQEPWECLASFILSSTKQIVQIQQIVALLCERYGDSLEVPDGLAPAFSFPSAERLARLCEQDLRACKMGFRAPYLCAAAKAVAEGRLCLAKLSTMSTESAREELLRLPGVGVKIANCVLLFAYGFQDAFPVDVWVSKALRELYFPKRKVTAQRLERFARTHFGRYPGYAQQYLFHYMRTRDRQSKSPSALKRSKS